MDVNGCDMSERKNSYGSTTIVRIGGGCRALVEVILLSSLSIWGEGGGVCLWG